MYYIKQRTLRIWNIFFAWRISEWPKICDEKADTIIEELLGTTVINSLSPDDWPLCTSENNEM